MDGEEEAGTGCLNDKTDGEEEAGTSCLTEKTDGEEDDNSYDRSSYAYLLFHFSLTFLYSSNGRIIFLFFCSFMPSLFFPLVSE